MAPEHNPQSRGRRSALLVSVAIICSRLFGLFRQRVFAFYFGDSWMADAFTAALRIPNITQNLLGEGTLSASFIPIYAGALRTGETERARRFAREALGALLLVVGLVSFVGLICAGPIVHLIVPGFEDERFKLAVHLVRIFFPMTGMLALAAWSLGILNSHRTFFLPYVAPVLWSLCQIIAMFLGSGLLPTPFGNFQFLPAFASGPKLVVVLGYGALVGAALQLFVQFPKVKGFIGSLRPKLDLRSPEVRKAAGALGNVVVGRGVVQISALFDSFLASLLPVGSNAILGYVQGAYSLPVSLFGVGAAAVALPEMVNRAGAEAGGVAAVRHELGEALTRVAFLTIPTTLAFLVLPEQIIGPLYQTGKFDAATTHLVAVALAGAGIGLLANTSVRLLATAFYALHDTRTPAQLSVVRVVLSIGFSYALMQRFGILGLTIGSSLGAWIEILMLGTRAYRRLGGLSLPLDRWARILAAAMLGAAAGWGMDQIPLTALSGKWLVMSRAAVALGTMGTVYLAAAAALRLPDVFEVWAAVRRRIKK